jgi:hypothetical protein
MKYFCKQRLKLSLQIVSDAIDFFIYVYRSSSENFIFMRVIKILDDQAKNNI